MRFFQIAIPQAALPALTYKSSDAGLSIGDLVKIKLRGKDTFGLIIDEIKSEPEYLVYEIESKFFATKININIINFYLRVKEYYLESWGTICKLALPVKPDFDQCSHQIKYPDHFNLHMLSDEQLLIASQVKEGVSVLQGVTGSGKTEVYFHLAAEQIRAGNQVLILLPEIGLTTQIISRFEDRFGFSPVVWNSSISQLKKKKYLADIISGSSRLIIGARSALFLPYKNLKLIVVDEEHDSSYKQENVPMYNARDMAILRASYEKIPVLLCSATPSIETLFNIEQGRYKLFRLNNRFGRVLMPEIKIINMQNEKLEKDKWISKTMEDAISKALINNSQVLLFLNRRGYSPLMLCRDCGYSVNCKNCSVWMVYHQSNHRLECHHCGMVSALPKICPDCKSEESFRACGPGIERIAQEISAIFPNARIQIMTRDNMKKQADINNLINNIVNNNVDIILGTQIITKGYHFPNLNFVGIIDGDIGLSGEDLKSSERSFQLLQQVSGRAGRESKGVVYLQTHQPNSVIIKALANFDQDSFMKHELEHRKKYNMPPITKIVSLTVSGKDEIQTWRYANYIVSQAPENKNVKIMGPTAAIINKINNNYRYKILINSTKSFKVQSFIKHWFENFKRINKFKIRIDFDPYSFY